MLEGEGPLATIVQLGYTVASAPVSASDCLLACTSSHNAKA